MWMRVARWAAVLGFAPLLCALLCATLCATTPPPAAWVPIRWPWADAQSLELLSGTAVNCLLLTVFAVTNANDTGTGSLRQAIISSNATNLQLARAQATQARLEGLSPGVEAMIRSGQLDVTLTPYQNAGGTSTTFRPARVPR
jgi:hypothetical protein